MILRPYQDKAVEAIFDYFKREKGNPLEALPTGTGKSVIIAEFIRRACTQFPQTRILMATHVQELIEQNFEKLKTVWPQAPAGIYSAGLDRRDLGFPITYAGIQSVASMAQELGRIDLFLIDEAHLVSPKSETLYMKLIDGLLKINPYMKVIGFTATAYRLGLGMLTEGGIFDHICFDLTTKDRFNELLADGYLTRLVPRTTYTEVSAEGVKIQGGEFVLKDLQAAVDKEAITHLAMQEIIHYGQTRKHWLIFASGLEHSNHICEMLNSMGVAATTVDGKIDKKTRKQRLDDFKAGRYQAMVNYGVLTTGFDFPGIDLIASLRPTMSPGLWVQKLGRGTRPVYAEGFDLSTAEGRLAAIAAGPKPNCLVLDFARNTVRLGPINDPVIPSARGRGDGKGMAPVRLCTSCGCYCHASVRICPECGFIFPINLDNYSAQASSAVLIAEDSMPKVVDHNVDKVEYTEHTKEGKPPSMKVTYRCGYRSFHEYVCFEYDGYARKKACDWWRKRSSAPPPPTTELALLAAPMLPMPKTIKVHENKKYPEILNHGF